MRFPHHVACAFVSVLLCLGCASSEERPAPLRPSESLPGVAELERASRLKRYLSPVVAESIVSGTQDVSLGSSRKLLTTFFSDIRGFTSSAEHMEPEELVTGLNEYFSEMTDIVFKHGGTLDKYVGDAIMVFFGDPIPQEDHAERAVRMGFEMLDRLRSLEEHWLRRYAEVFEIGIGITTGWVTVGDIGSHFPNTDERWANAESFVFLRFAVGLMKQHGYSIANLDSTIEFEQPKLRPYIEKIRNGLAQALETDVSFVSVKAKTGEGVDAVGSREAIRATAVVLIRKDEV